MERIYSCLMRKVKKEFVGWEIGKNKYILQEKSSEELERLKHEYSQKLKPIQECLSRDFPESDFEIIIRKSE